MMNKICGLFHNPASLVTALGKRRLLNWMSDEAYVKLLYRAGVGKRLNLENPQTYNEKLQWLKIYDRQPLYNKIVDKYEVRNYVAEKIGSKYLIPLVGGPWEAFDQIDFNSLPEQFVLKCTHDSGGVVVCKNKSVFNREKAKAFIDKHLKTNFFWAGREWAYKDVTPRIIAEQYMEDSTTAELRDYKFFCFEGVPRYLFVATERQNETEDTKFDFFDMDYQHLDIKNGHPNAKVSPRKPMYFEEMKRLAAVLSKEMPQLRVDFYEVNGNVYFGELTLSHWSGAVAFEPEEWDRKFGEWIRLPKSEQGCRKSKTAHFRLR